MSSDINTTQAQNTNEKIKTPVSKEKEVQTCIDDTCKDTENLQKNVQNTVEKALEEKEANTTTEKQLESAKERQKKQTENKLSSAKENSDKVIANAEKKEITQSVSKLSADIKKQAFSELEQHKDGDIMSESMQAVAESYISKIPPTDLFNLSNEESVVDIVKSKINISENEEQEDGKIHTLVTLYIKAKIAEAKTKATDDSTAPLQTMHFVEQNGKYTFITQKQFDTQQATQEKIAEQSEVMSDWLANNKDIQKRLQAASNNKAEYDQKVNETINGEGHFFLKILNWFLGGNLASIAGTDSFIGRAVRAFTDIPDPEKNMNPLTPAMKKHANNKKNRAEIITKIHENIGGVNNTDALKDYQGLSKTGQITSVLTSSFGVSKDNIPEPVQEETENSVRNTLTIPTKSANQFTDIYSFLQSPNENQYKDLSQNIKKKQEAMADDTGAFGAAGKSALDVVNSFTDILDKSSISVTGGLSSMIMPKSKNIADGHPEYSNIKAEIGFPTGLSINTTPSGNITISWNEEVNEQEEASEEEN